MIIAHAIGGRTDLPVPLPVLIAGATAVLVITFLGLGMLWKYARLQDGARYQGPGVPAPVNGALGVIGILALLIVIAQVLVPLLGVERVSTRATSAAVLVWVIFWLVVPFASALIGNWYRDLNPWRTLARVLRLGDREQAVLVGRLGVWPATLGLLGFVWLETIHPRPGSPTVLGVAATAYTIYLLGSMAVLGRETGATTFDVFTPYNRLLSAMSPFGRHSSGRVVWRGWLRALPEVPEWPGLWVFVVAMIATVSYDGASGSVWFETVTRGLSNTMAGRTLLLLATVGVVGAVYYLACYAAARSAGAGWTAGRVAQRFAHTLVPIALAYAVSHYFTLVLFEGQQLIATASDPFGLGWDLFGTAGYRVNYFIASSTPIWFTQVGFIVAGHLVGVVLAHDRSLGDFGRDALRSQSAMLVLMVALTSLGLLILSG